MRDLRWLVALIAVLAVGLVAAGCGDDDESSDTTTPAATSEETTSEDTTAEETTTEDADEPEISDDSATPDDIYNACIDVIEGTPAATAGQASCEQVRTAFEQCTKQAEASGNEDAIELAVRACQQAADQTLAALESGGG